MVWLKIFLLSTAMCWPTSDIKFETKQLLIGDTKLTVEVADSIKKRSQGLMNRLDLKPGHGMLFIHDRPEIAGYWMKNTYINLSIGFFDKNKKLIEVYDLKKTASMLSTKIDQVQSKQKVKYALEVPKGWFKNNNIKRGETFRLLD